MTSDPGPGQLTVSPGDHRNVVRRKGSLLIAGSITSNQPCQKGTSRLRRCAVHPRLYVQGLHDGSCTVAGGGTTLMCAVQVPQSKRHRHYRLPAKFGNPGRPMGSLKINWPDVAAGIASEVLQNARPLVVALTSWQCLSTM